MWPFKRKFKKKKWSGWEIRKFSDGKYYIKKPSGWLDARDYKYTWDLPIHRVAYCGFGTWSEADKVFRQLTEEGTVLKRGEEVCVD